MNIPTIPDKAAQENKIVQNESDEISQKQKKKATERTKKNVLMVVQPHNLEVRDIALSSKGKYLVSCSESNQKETPKVSIWNVEKLIEGFSEPEGVLEGVYKENENLLTNNWILCIDTINAEIDNTKRWIICAGSISGEIYIWSGKVDSVSEKWMLDNLIKKVFVEKSEISSKAIHDIKIVQDATKKTDFNIYYGCNNIQAIFKNATKDNELKEITISLKDSDIVIPQASKLIGTLNEWIVSLDVNINDPQKNYIVCGSKDGSVYKWNINNSSKMPILIGTHDDSVNCVKTYADGSCIASCSLDNTIRIWNNTDGGKPELISELKGHTDAVVSIDIQKDDDLLISVSKDNTIKIWDLHQSTWIRSIDVDYLMEKSKKVKRDNIKGMDFLRCIKISPDNRFIFVTKYNKIIALRNFGVVWQFDEQLKFIKECDQELYKKIYGENLKQIAKRSPDDEDTLKKLYETIKKRLIQTTRLELSLKGEISTDKSSEYNMRELGTLLLPSFIKFEMEKKGQTNQSQIKNQKEYILGAQENYDSTWNSIKNSIFKLPDQPWQFRFLVTTDMEDDIKDAKFVEITDPKNQDVAHIILKDRKQSQVRFLMMIDNIPLNLIPLISNINIELEDDRGDKDTLFFSDFTYSYNFVQILTDPQKSTEKSKPLSEPDEIFYAYCTFQLNEGYSTEMIANIFIRKISLEFCDKLNPLEGMDKDPEDIQVFEAFKNNFKYPLIPKIQIQIGKGIASAIGKMIDEYFAKIILVEFLFSFWGFLEVGIPALVPGLVIPDWISNIVSISGIAIIVVIFISMFIKSRKK